MSLIEQGTPYWLDEEQTRMVMESNQRFQMRSPEEMLFHDYFTVPEREDEGEFMSTTEIFQRLKQQAGSTLRNGNVKAFGHMLVNVDGIIRRRTRFGTEYLVKPKEKS